MPVYILFVGDDAELSDINAYVSWIPNCYIQCKINDLEMYCKYRQEMLCNSFTGKMKTSQ